MKSISTKFIFFCSFLGLSIFGLSQKEIKPLFHFRNQILDSNVDSNHGDIEGKFLNFNSVPILNSFTEKGLPHLTKKSNKGTLIMVYFKPTENYKPSQINFKHGLFKLNVIEKEVSTENDYQLGPTDEAAIMTINYNRNSDLPSVIYDLEAENNVVFEFLFYPELLSLKKRTIQETYLSLKSGISMNQAFSYLNSLGDTLWNAEKLKSYSNRVTGIGRDDVTGIEQFKSHNLSEKDFIVAFQDSTIQDLDFLLLGDDNGPKIFENTDSDIEVFQRIWKLNSFVRSNQQVNFNIATGYFQELKENEIISLAVDFKSTSGFNLENADIIPLMNIDGFLKSTGFSVTRDGFFTFIKSNLEQDFSSQPINDFLSQIKVYPNPVDFNEDFKVELLLEKPANVDIIVNDLSGRLVSSESFENIQYYTYSKSLKTSGMYLVSITVDGITSTYKLIAK